MFILIEDRAEIRRAQSQLETTLRREFSIKKFATSAGKVTDCGPRAALEWRILVLVAGSQDHTQSAAIELVWPDQ